MGSEWRHFSRGGGFEKALVCTSAIVQFANKTVAFLFKLDVVWILISFSRAEQRVCLCIVLVSKDVVSETRPISWARFSSFPTSHLLDDISVHLKTAAVYCAA